MKSFCILCFILFGFLLPMGCDDGHALDRLFSNEIRILGLETNRVLFTDKNSFRVYELSEHEMKRILEQDSLQANYGPWQCADPMGDGGFFGFGSEHYYIHSNSKDPRIGDVWFCRRKGYADPYNMIAIYIEKNKKRLILIDRRTYGR